ncbi:formin-binding 1-like isoform X3 [Brachionus plicatilis]|uniref:Formin-binding 1-like isoform X3 n=1 Tax=Brachionus plicatilis TaxID=10195 RepID=A0A3M7SEI4_BRAPC|nr:formin-binding 1-like isoform X3 [Brachionus plicatilis]
MRWGSELWDRFDDIANHVHKGLEFCEKYEDFWKKRCSIENSYAKSLRRLCESYEPKRKEPDDDSATHIQCFARVLGETRDMAGQHELIAENVQERVLGRLGLVVKALKEERRKCIEDRDKHLAVHVAHDELMDKCRVKYEKSFREMEKADELLTKVENDDSASKNDIKKQKSVCEQKKRHFDAAEADYGKQLYEANRAKNAYYTEQLPAVLDALQSIEQRRLLQFKQCVADCAAIELEVVPRIGKCLAEVEAAARAVDSDHDSDLLVSLYKTGYSFPADHLFDDLKQAKSKDNRSLHTLNQTVLSNNSNSSSSSISNNQTINRHKKYRTLNRIKGLFAAAGAITRPEDANELPPAQMKNDLVKKIAATHADIDKQQKERQGLLKLKDIYSTNEKFGDSSSAEQALCNNDQKLDNLHKQLMMYEEMLAQVEQSLAQATQTSVYHQYDCSSSSSSGTLSKHQHIYQSPSRASVTSAGWSAPATPAAHKQCESAYAVSGVGMAPLVSSNNSESFDDEDDDENYDSPSADHVDHVDGVDGVDGVIGTALVMYSFDGNVQNSISIEENESLNVLERDSGDGWTLVQKLNGERGYVPTDYIQIVYY